MFEKIYKGSIFMENIFDVKCLFNRGQLENGNLIAYFGNIRTLFPVTSGQRFGIIRTA